MNTEITTLREAELDAFLDQIIESLEEQEAADVPADIWQASCAKILEQHDYAPDTMQMVHRLFRVYLRVNLPQKALNVLDKALPEMLALPHENSDSVRLSFAFWHIEIVMTMPDQTQIENALAHAENLLSSRSLSEQSDDAWDYFTNWTFHAKDFVRAEKCAIARHALATSRPERKAFRSWDDTLLAIRLGFVARAAEDLERVKVEAQKALDCLQNAVTTQPLESQHLNV